jgi:hypothetical protein
MLAGKLLAELALSPTIHDKELRVGRGTGSCNLHFAMAITIDPIAGQA